MLDVCEPVICDVGVGIFIQPDRDTKADNNARVIANDFMSVAFPNS